MTDLTPLFKQCVEIVAQELGKGTRDNFDIVNTRHKTASPYAIKDTFTKESLEFHYSLVNLDKFIEEIKSPYASINDEQKAHLSIEDKNRIDAEFNYKVQQLYEKLKFLQSYESKRQGLIKSAPKKSFFNQFFSTGDDDDFIPDSELFSKTVGNHRTLILKSLNNSLNIISKKFDTIQKRRMAREKQLLLLNFQNIEDDSKMIDIDQYIQQQEEEDSPLQFTQEQIQVLEEENQEFLSLKQTQVKQVEQLHTSMVDIMNLQNELTFQLDTQSDQINSLLENHSQVEVDVLMGNKQLNSATKRNKRSANLLVMLCIILGVLLLLIDYVSF